MTRVLDATQVRDQRASFAKIDLVKITTYTDRKDKTGAKAFYLSTQAILYDYGNTGTDQSFWPVLNSSEPSNSISHLPGPGDRVRREFEVILSNARFGGPERLIGVLRRFNLTNAEIEFAQLSVEGPFPTGRIDFSSLTGDEHSVFERGVVARIGRVDSEQIVLECQTDVPSLANFWRYPPLNINVDPKDIGRRYPMPMGRAKRVQCVGRQVGWVTTLTDPINASETGIVGVADGWGFAGGQGNIRIGNETVSLHVTPDRPEPNPYLGDSPPRTYININQRGIEGSRKQRHQAGEIVVGLSTGISEIVFTAAGYATSFIVDMYIRNPVANDELVKIPSGLYTVDSNDTTTDSFPTTTATFTPSNLQSALRRMFSDVFLEIPEDPDVITESTELAGAYNELSSSTFFDNDARLVTDTFQDVNHVGGGSPLSEFHTRIFFTHSGLPANDDVLSYFFRIAHRGFFPNSTNKLKLLVAAFNFPGIANGTIILDYQYADESGSTPVILTDSDFVIDIEGQGFDINDFGNPAETTTGPYLHVEHYTNRSSRDIELQVNARIAPDQFELVYTEITGSSGNPNQPEIVGATVGFGIDVYADVDGPVSPDTSYSGGVAGQLLARAPDVAKFLIEEVGGETLEAQSFTDSLVNLPDETLDFDWRVLGEDFEDLAAGVGYNSRSNLFPEDTNAGREWRMLQAGTGYKWAAPTQYIRSLGSGVVETGRAIRNLASSWVFRYGIDASRGDSEDAYRGLAIAAPTGSTVGFPITGSQLQDAEERFGSVQAPQQFLRGIRNQLTAEKVAGYYVHEGIADLRRELALPNVVWYEAYRLQVGDLRWVVPPWNEIAPDDEIFPMDAVGSWTATNATLAAVNAPFGSQHGNAVLKCTQTSGSVWSMEQNDFGSETDGRLVDMRGRAFSFRLQIDAAAHALLATGGAAFTLVLGSSASGAPPIRSWEIPKENLPDPDTWGTFVIPLSLTPDDESGTLDETKITFWFLQITCFQDGAGSSFYADHGQIVDVPIAARITSIRKITVAEHSDITVVEVPAPVSIAAGISGAITVPDELVQSAQRVYGGVAAESGARAYVRDGRTEDLEHYAQVADGPEFIEFGTGEPPLDVEFNFAPYPERESKTFRLFVNRLGNAGIQDFQLSETQGGTPTTSFGGVPFREIPIHPAPPAEFQFTTNEPGEWIRIIAGGLTSADRVQVFHVDRIFNAVDAPPVDIQKPSTTPGGGTGTDLANAVDDDGATFALLDDGEFVQAQFAAPAAYLAQLIRVDYVSQLDASVPDGIAVYLGDVRGGSPTAIITPDSGLTDDVVTSNRFRTQKRSFASFTTRVADDNVFVYGEAGDKAVEVYRIERSLIRIATRFTQMPKQVFNGDTRDEPLRAGARIVALQEIQEGWGAKAPQHPPGNPINFVDVEFSAPPTAITTTQTIVFSLASLDGIGHDVEILVGATQGAGSVEATVQTTAQSQLFEVTTAATGNWVRFRGKTDNDSFEQLRSVVRVLPDSQPAVIEVQQGATAGGVGVTNPDNAIDGDSQTAAILDTNDHLEVNMPTPGTYDTQRLVIDFESSGTPIEFSIFINGIKTVGTSITPDETNDVVRYFGTARMRFQINTDTVGDDFFLYNEGVNTFSVFEMSIKRLDT